MRLPLLSFVSSLFPDVNLEDTLLLACQHVLGTTVDLFSEMFKAGLAPAEAYLIGKCYSAHPPTLQRLANLGVHVSADSTTFTSHVPFDDQFDAYVRSFLTGVERATRGRVYRRVIVLDDGAHLLRAIGERGPRSAGPVVGIEQTSSGYRALRKQQFSLPVVNVARSPVKLTLESPFVAAAVRMRFDQYFAARPSLRPTRILVLGHGPVGAAVAANLSRDYLVTCRDAGQSPDALVHLLTDNFDMIIGATGTRALTATDVSQLRPGTILTSVSSSDREFPAASLRRLLPPTSDCHRHIDVNGVSLLNSGFPLNFDGQEHSVPPQEIQLTRALLLAAVYQAAQNPLPLGLVDLEWRVQRLIADEFQRLHASVAR